MYGKVVEQFMYLLSICTSSFEKFLYNSFSHLFIVLFIILVLICFKFSIYSGH
jgi:hypothetical protein